MTLVRSCQISEMFRLPKACCNCRGRLSECMPATKRIAVVHQVVSKLCNSESLEQAHDREASESEVISRDSARGPEVAGAPASATTTASRARARSVVDRRYVSITAKEASARFVGAPASASTSVSRAGTRSVIGRRYASITVAGASHSVQGMWGRRHLPPQPCQENVEGVYRVEDMRA